MKLPTAPKPMPWKTEPLDFIAKHRNFFTLAMIASQTGIKPHKLRDCMRRKTELTAHEKLRIVAFFKFIAGLILEEYPLETGTTLHNCSGDCDLDPVTQMEPQDIR
jgi:hypothetical protein